MGRISEAVAESFGVRQVYGESIEREGALVIPAARVWSSGGAGSGVGAAAERATREDRDTAESETDAPADGGGGIGFGRRAEPAGAFVVEDHGVRWVPAVDVNRIVLGGQLAFVLAAVVVGWALARRRRA
jgi:uncharacterized spore protein YtfJ